MYKFHFSLAEIVSCRLVERAKLQTNSQTDFGVPLTPLIRTVGFIGTFRLTWWFSSNASPSCPDRVSVAALEKIYDTRVGF